MLLHIMDFNSFITAAQWASTTELIIRFIINLLIAYVIIHNIYYRYQQNKEFLFTFYVFNVLIFFICFVMMSIDVGTGFGMGMFAVFSILRYRTGTLPIKEMTYLFIVIGVGLVNALANNYPEMLFINLVIMGIPYYLERNFRRFQEAVKPIVYEKIEMIQPQNQALLIEDLKQRTGLNIHRVDVEKIDFLRDVASLKAYYYTNPEG
jgi:hypothetical protein